MASFRPLSSFCVTLMLITHRYHHNDMWWYGRDLYISFSTRQIPILKAARSEAWVCGRSLARTAGSNHGENHVCRLCCVLSGRGLCDSPIMSVGCVVCCLVEVSATVRSLVHRSATDSVCVCVCVCVCVRA